MLKPLYSFAGLGVKDRTKCGRDWPQYPAEQRSKYISAAQDGFRATIDTPSGLTKAEIRIMYIWDGEMMPVMALLRTGRGKMMGVDFNKNLDWVGASAGFLFPSRKLRQVVGHHVTAADRSIVMASMRMRVSPLNPSQLVNIPRLVASYYTIKPDPARKNATSRLRYIRTPRLFVRRQFQRRPHSRDFTGNLCYTGNNKEQAAHCFWGSTRMRCLNLPF